MTYKHVKPSRLTRALKRRQQRDLASALRDFERSGLSTLSASKIAGAVLEKSQFSCLPDEFIGEVLKPFLEAMVGVSGLVKPLPKEPRGGSRHWVELYQEIEDLRVLTQNSSQALGGVIDLLVRIAAVVSNASNGRVQDKEASLSFSVSLHEVIPRPTKLVSRMIELIRESESSSTLKSFRVFRPLLLKLDNNSRKVAGLLDGENWRGKRRPCVTDPKFGGESERLGLFCRGTPFETLFQSKVQVSISVKQRMENMMILAPTGWGKTQTLEHMIDSDLREAQRGNRSLIVMESEGDLIRRIARHPVFDRRIDGNIADRLYYIEPGKLGYTPTFSFFDFGGRSNSDLSGIEREQISNTVVDLYRYIFRALRGSELTEKQGYLFVQLVNLLSTVPGATFLTLLECLEETDAAMRLAKSASPRLRDFFQKKYSGPNYKQTREQIFTRLDTFRATSETFVEMVSGAESNFDLLGAINSSSVVVINTSKEFLGEEASSVFGCYIIALLRQASFRRSDRDIPCFVYLDEAQEYLDEKSEVLFQQARKRNIGLTIAHQGLQQIRPDLRSTILINTATKLCGNSNFEDRAAMARNMNTSAEFLGRLQKYEGRGSEFALFARDVTKGGAVSVHVPFGSFKRAGLIRDLPPGRWLNVGSPKERPAAINDLCKPSAANAEVPPSSPWMTSDLL